MTQLESQVTTLEMSKKLDEAGLWIETPLVWVVNGAEDEQRNVISYVELRKNMPLDYPEVLPAYTFQQVWEELPNKVMFDSTEIKKHVSWFVNRHTVGYDHCNIDYIGKFFESKSLPDAAAQAWLWCKEKGYLNHG